MSKRILFFGNERLATGVTTTTPTLRALIENGYDIAAVVVAQNEVGSSRQARQLEIAQTAKEHGIELLSPANLSEALPQLKSYQAEAAVLIAYGQLVPPEIINIFLRGIINVHPSLLPKHRGPIPLESVILNGEGQTGVSLMQLVEKMDAGPVYSQETVRLSGKETKQELADSLSQLGSQLVIKNLPAILQGDLQPVLQNESDASEDKRISKEDGIIDWNKPAANLEREIRAYQGWPRSRTNLGYTNVIITKARVAEGGGKSGEIIVENRQLGVYTGQGKLVIDSLIPAGKKEMSASAFLAGYRLN